MYIKYIKLCHRSWIAYGVRFSTAPRKFWMFWHFALIQLLAKQRVLLKSLSFVLNRHFPHTLRQQKNESGSN